MQGDNESIASFSVRSLHANVENEDIIRKIPIEEDLGSDEDLFLRGYIYLKRNEGFQSMVTEINEVIENVVMDDRATILNPLPGFVVNYRDHNDIILTPFVPWIYFFKELDSIIIKEQYERPAKEIRIEGIREDIKIDIGSIESFGNFIRTLQLLWSSYTNKNPEDYFCSSMPWEGYDVYLLKGHTRIVTHSWSWEPDGSGRRFVEVVPGDDTRAERVVGAGAEIYNPEDFTDSTTSDANSRMVDVDHEDFSQWAVKFIDRWTEVKSSIERIVMVQF